MLDNQEKEINKGQKFCTGRIVMTAITTRSSIKVKFLRRIIYIMLFLSRSIYPFLLSKAEFLFSFFLLKTKSLYITLCILCDTFPVQKYPGKNFSSGKLFLYSQVILYSTASLFQEGEKIFFYFFIKTAEILCSWEKKRKRIFLTGGR